MGELPGQFESRELGEIARIEAAYTTRNDECSSQYGVEEVGEAAAVIVCCWFSICWYHQILSYSGFLRQLLLLKYVRVRVVCGTLQILSRLR